MDFTIDTRRPQPNIFMGGYRFYIKIDENGNVNITEQDIDGHTGRIYPNIRDRLVIHDNIPIPVYVMRMLETLLVNKTLGTDIRYLDIFEGIKIMKAELYSETPKWPNKKKFGKIGTKYLN